jgi:hypothetical protein
MLASNERRKDSRARRKGLACGLKERDGWSVHELEM